MKVDVLTLFPEMFSALNSSIIGRAMQAGLLDIRVTDIRPFSAAKHKNTDDYPFGGGAGMLMTPQPLAEAIKAVGGDEYCGVRVLLSPRGVQLTQDIARQLSTHSHLMLICGHYEGVDERIIQGYVDMELSIGDYVLTGGELPAMVLIDCLARLQDGVLGSEHSAQDESFSIDGLLEYPQYTRPRVFEGREVPPTLLSGNHAEIAAWRRQQSLMITARRRPDMLGKADITPKERQWLTDQGLPQGNM